MLLTYSASEKGAAGIETPGPLTSESFGAQKIVFRITGRRFKWVSPVHLSRGSRESLYRCTIPVFVTQMHCSLGDRRLHAADPMHIEFKFTGSQCQLFDYTVKMCPRDVPPHLVEIQGHFRYPSETSCGRHLHALGLATANEPCAFLPSGHF